MAKIEIVTFSHRAKALSSSDIDATERYLGVRLPDQLRAHYLEVNGGSPEPNAILGPEGLELVINSFLPMRHRPSSAALLLEEVYRDLVRGKALIPDRWIPFAMDGGGDFFCIGRNGQYVCFYAMDQCDDPDRATTLIAPSLAELFENLGTTEDLFGY